MVSKFGPQENGGISEDAETTKNFGISRSTSSLLENSLFRKKAETVTSSERVGVLLKSCDQCDSLFQTADSLEHHRLSVHSSSIDGETNLEIAKLEGSGIKRKAIVHNDKCSKLVKVEAELKLNANSQVQCTKCNRTFTFEDLKKQRFKNHQFVCKNCTLRNRVTDIQSHVPTEQNLQFKDNNSIEIIQEVIYIEGHKLLNQIECEKCSEKFMFCNIKKHVALGEKSEFLCRKCGKEFKWNNNSQRGVAERYKNELEFMCKICKIICKSKEQLDGHVPIHNLRCEKCNVLFEFRYLQKHVGLSEKSEYVCLQCNELFKWDVHFQKEVDLQYRNKLIFQCTLCQLAFICKQYLERHLLVHRTLECEKCNVVFSVSGMKEHVAVSETSEYLCLICDEPFKWNDDFQKEVAVKYEKELDFICKKCSFVCKSKKRLDMHVVTDHCSLKCKKCEVVFEFKNVKTHVAISETSDYACIKCGELFKFTDGIKKHITQYSLCYMCTKCVIVVPRKEYLERHVSLYHVKCEKCCKEFKCKDFENHVILNDKSQLLCKTCGALFNWSDDFKRQVALTYNLMLYKCTKCFLSFKLKEELDQHVEFDHIECEKCNDVLTFDNLENQFRFNCNDKFLCEKCGNVFKWTEGFKRRIAVRCKFKFACSVCNRSFKNVRDLERHVLNKYCAC